MKPAAIKNILQSVIYFLEYDKHFDLCDESENNLESFLTELNRFRAVASLEPIVLEKVIPTSTGGQKCRFNVASKVKVVKTAKTAKVVEVEVVETLEPAKDKVHFKKITRAAFVDLLKNHFDSAVAKANREDDTPVTNYFVDDVLVGSWAKAAGWHATS